MDWTNGWLKRWTKDTDGRTEKRRMDELMNGRTEGWTGGTNARTGLTDGVDGMDGGTERMDRQTDRWNNQTDRWKSGRMDGRIDRLIND